MPSHERTPAYWELVKEMRRANDVFIRCVSETSRWREFYEEQNDLWKRLEKGTLTSEAIADYERRAKAMQEEKERIAQHVQALHTVYCTAKESIEDALRLARQIPVLTYRCRAITTVAEACNKTDLLQNILREGLRDLDLHGDDDEKVGLRGSFIGIAIKAGLAGLTSREIEKAVRFSNQISHRRHRALALGHVWKATLPLQPEQRAVLQQATIDACLTSRSWRGGDLLHEMIYFLVGKAALNEAISIYEQMPLDQFKKRSRNLLRRAGAEF